MRGETCEGRDVCEERDRVRPGRGGLIPRYEGQVGPNVVLVQILSKKLRFLLT